MARRRAVFGILILHVQDIACRYITMHIASTEKPTQPWLAEQQFSGKCERRLQSNGLTNSCVVYALKDCAEINDVV
jgi:hypothetical protein